MTQVRFPGEEQVCSIAPAAGPRWEHCAGIVWPRPATRLAGPGCEDLLTEHKLSTVKVISIIWSTLLTKKGCFLRFTRFSWSPVCFSPWVHTQQSTCSNDLTYQEAYHRNSLPAGGRESRELCCPEKWNKGRFAAQRDRATEGQALAVAYASDFTQHQLCSKCFLAWACRHGPPDMSYPLIDY